MIKLEHTFLAGALALLAACPADDTDQDTDSASDTDMTMDTETEDAFVFEEDDPSAFVQVDRIGMPGVATALIASKDEYNQGMPVDDANYAEEIAATVEVLHGALDDDLDGLGLTPCRVEDCVMTAAPFVIPDVISIDTSAASGFPNGRQLSDPVMDVVLALLLLDLNTHEVTTFADLPLNPPANDVAFMDAFPYLAPPHAL